MDHAQWNEKELPGLLTPDRGPAHTSKTLSRTLDILHVATLIELGCDGLVSGDERQLSLAKAERIRTLDITARA